MNKKPMLMIVAFTVDATWVADGFTPTDERMHDMIWRALGSATHDQCSAKVLYVSPGPTALFGPRYQGFTGAALSREVRAYDKATPARLKGPIKALGAKLRDWLISLNLT